jgi:trans-aconitate methyltransferase
MSEEYNWSTYYQRMAGREPRPLLTRVLALYDIGSDTSRQAVDLGCGDGTETRLLIERGWKVLAIDREPEAGQLVEDKVPAEKRDRLQIQLASFEDAQFVPADLIYAGLSLPFCSPQLFDMVWRRLTESIRPGGRFAGHFFGDRDTWASKPEMSCLTRQAVEKLFDQFELEYFDEIEDDRTTSLGEPKHWHLFEVIARKRT